VLAEIGEIGRFHNQEAVVQYAGLAAGAGVGGKARGAGSRAGSPWLRWIWGSGAGGDAQFAAARRY